jgi:hypothetical protein
MPLDPTTAQIVENWLVAHCPDLACPACGLKRWGGAELAYSTLAQTPVTRGLKPPPPPAPDVLPLVHLFCVNCGCNVVFSAASMGLIKPPPGIKP